MTQRVVNRLELIQIDIKQRDQRRVAMGLNERRLQPLFEQAAVGQPGQRFVARLMREILLMRLLRRHVVLNTHEMGQLAGIVGHRGHEHVVPEGAAVLAIIEQRDSNIAGFADPLTDQRKGSRIGVRPPQETTVSPEHLVAAIAGHALERLVDVDEWKIGEARVRDHNAVDRGFHTALENTQLGLLRPAPRDVLRDAVHAGNGAVDHAGEIGDVEHACFAACIGDLYFVALRLAFRGGLEEAIGPGHIVFDDEIPIMKTDEVRLGHAGDFAGRMVDAAQKPVLVEREHGIGVVREQ